MSRPVEELKTRAGYVLQLSDDLRKQFINIAKTNLPSSALNLAVRLAERNNVDPDAAATATRWLAVVYRDYGQKVFDEMVK